jgi:hypothetical protein
MAQLFCERHAKRSGVLGVLHDQGALKEITAVKSGPQDKVTVQQGAG